MNKAYRDKKEARENLMQYANLHGDELIERMVNTENPNSPCNYAGATKAQYAVFELLYDIRYKKPIRFSWLTWDEADKLPHVSYSTSLLMGGLSSTAEQQYPSLLIKMHRKLKDASTGTTALQKKSKLHQSLVRPV